MFRFESPEYLYWLLVIPALLLVLFYERIKQKRNLRRMGDSEVVKSLMPDYSRPKKTLKLSLLIAAIVGTILTLARPQFGMKIDASQEKGIEIMFALDVSNSMLAQDVSPNRLEKAKSLISGMINNMKGNKVGLLIFAGDAFIQLPMTPDYVSAQMFLNAITPEMVRAQGTDIARALSLAGRGFSARDDIGKAIVIITDGEEHEGGVENAIKQTLRKNIRTFVVGVGSTEGAPIPLDGGAYLTDIDGNVVTTCLNESMCRSIAGDGAYFRLENTSSTRRQLEGALDKMTKGDIENPIYSNYNEQFQLIAFLVCLILMIEACIRDRKSKWVARIRLFKKK